MSYVHHPVYRYIACLTGRGSWVCNGKRWGCGGGWVTPQLAAAVALVAETSPEAEPFVASERHEGGREGFVFQVRALTYPYTVGVYTSIYPYTVGVYTSIYPDTVGVYTSIYPYTVGRYVAPPTSL